MSIDAPPQPRFLDNSERILHLLRKRFDGEFHGFFDGDPVIVGVSQLPAFAVELMSTVSSKGPTGFDRWTDTILIKVILNKKDDMGDQNPQKQSTYVRLKTYVFGRDADGKFQPNSVANLIRTNFSLDDVLIDQQFAVEFGIAERPQQTVTAEAHVTITADYLVEIAQRNANG